MPIGGLRVVTVGEEGFVYRKESRIGAFHTLLPLPPLCSEKAWPLFWNKHMEIVKRLHSQRERNRILKEAVMKNQALTLAVLSLLVLVSGRLGAVDKAAI